MVGDYINTMKTTFLLSFDYLQTFSELQITIYQRKAFLFTFSVDLNVYVNPYCLTT